MHQEPVSSTTSCWTILQILRFGAEGWRGGGGVEEGRSEGVEGRGGGGGGGVGVGGGVEGWSDRWQACWTILVRLRGAQSTQRQDSHEQRTALVRQIQRAATGRSFAALAQTATANRRVLLQFSS